LKEISTNPNQQENIVQFFKIYNKKIIFIFIILVIFIFVLIYIFQKSDDLENNNEIKKDFLQKDKQDLIYANEYIITDNNKI
jgi:hypothetical protein